MEKFDLIVIGGGAAGITVSRGPAAAGQKIALIEKSHMGGTCTNVGCMPTKALLASAHFLHRTRQAERYAVEIDGQKAPWLKVRQRMDNFVSKLREGSERFPQQFENLQLYRGEAYFTDPRTISVNGELLASERIVIAAGARSLIPAIPGLETVNYLTSTSALALEEIPKDLTILGGGVLAVEFAQIFSRLGSSVTIIEQNDEILGNLDSDLTSEFRRSLVSEGIQVLVGHKVERLANRPSGIEIFFSSGAASDSLIATSVLVATGRKPNSDLLALSVAGVETDSRGFISTDQQFKTSADGVWAIGDITGGAMFTHKARHDGMLLSQFFRDGTPFDNQNRLVPSAIFTDPEIAIIGESEKSAEKKNLAFLANKLPYDKIGRARASSHSQGFIKILINPENKGIIGAQIIGHNAGEIIHTVGMAMYLGGTINDLQQMLITHPTYTEGLYSTAMLFGGI